MHACALGLEHTFVTKTQVIERENCGRTILISDSNVSVLFSGSKTAHPV